MELLFAICDKLDILGDVKDQLQEDLKVTLDKGESVIFGRCT